MPPLYGRTLPLVGMPPLYGRTLPLVGMPPLYGRTLPLVGMPPLYGRTLPLVGMPPLYGRTLPLVGMPPLYGRTPPLGGTLPLVREARRVGRGGWGRTAVELRSGSWQACWKALAKSWTLGKRLRGSFSKAVNTTSSIAAGRAGMWVRREAGGVCVCCTIISVMVPLKGRWPQSHS